MVRSGRWWWWLAAPPSDDPVVASEIALVYGTALVIAGVVPLVALTALVVGGPPRSYVLLGVLFVVDLAALWAIRAGLHRLVAAVGSLTIGVLLAALSPWYGGIRGTALQTLPFLVLVSTMALGQRAGALAWLGVVVAASASWGLEAAGLAVPTSSTPAEHFLTAVAVAGAVLALVSLKLRRLRTAVSAQAAALAQRHAELARRIETEGRLREAALAATAASEAKSRFLANMSHELRTPLNAILGYAELLQDEAGPDLAPDLARIHGAGTHLLALVDDVLDLSAIEAGRARISTAAVDLRSVVAEVGTTLAPVLAAHGNHLVTEFDADVAIDSDPRRVRQVLRHLVGNAARFTSNGAVSVQVRREGDGVSVAVTDTGVGIEPELQARLFQPFVQGDDTPVRRHGGTGLGLALCARVSALLGGRLSVVSAVGEGSTFTWWLPRRPPAARAG